MWDPHDPSRDRPRPGPRPDSDPDEPWVYETGPRPPSARTRAVILAVVSVAVLVSLFLACVLLVDLLPWVLPSWTPEGPSK